MAKARQPQLVTKEGEVYGDRRRGHSKKTVHAEPDSWRKIDA